MADLLGHDGTRTVAQVYRHAVSPTVDVAAARMERLLGGANEPDSGSPLAPPGLHDPENGTDQGGCPGQVGGP